MRQRFVGYVAYDVEPLTAPPLVRLKKRWLEKLGWTVGLKVEVLVGEDKIVIRKSAPVRGGGFERR